MSNTPKIKNPRLQMNTRQQIAETLARHRESQLELAASSDRSRRLAIIAIALSVIAQAIALASIIL